MYFDNKPEHKSTESIRTLKHIDLETILPWSKLGQVDVIKQWSEEVNLAIKSQITLEDWALVGHAITIIHDDIDECYRILQRVALDLDFNLEVLDAAAIQQQFSEEKFSMSVDKPTLVYLKPNSWMSTIDENDVDNKCLNSLLQTRICNLVKQFNPKKPIIFATSIANYNNFSKVFKHAGLFDRRFTVNKPSLDEIATNFIENVGLQICGDSLKNSLGKVGILLDLDFGDKRRQSLIALSLKRIANKEKRLVEFTDLVNLAMRGSGESDDYPTKSKDTLKQVAIHEAGHAAISIIDSKGANMPDYASIIESHNFAGIVSDSYEYHYAENTQKTYAGFRHQIRIFLGGRVAEHLVLGSENIVTGSATGDLKNATNLCFEMFAYRGIASEMEALECASSNLSSMLDPNSQSNLFRVETMVREYLQKQYVAVYEMLESNRSLFDEIVDEIMSNRILDQQDFIKIARLHTNFCSLI